MHLYNSDELDYAIPVKVNRQYGDCVINMTLNEFDMKYEFDTTYKIYDAQYAFGLFM